MALSILDPRLAEEKTVGMDDKTTWNVLFFGENPRATNKNTWVVELQRVGLS